MAATVAQRTKMAGLEARRADQMPAGSMVAVVAMELFGIAELTMSAWAMREGIVLEVIGRADPALWTSDAHAIRRSSVLGLARRCNWDEAHSRHVTRLALALFDATAELHRLGPDERELLDHAALLHDIGIHVAHESHHKHTAYLIQHGKLRGYDPEQVDALACLARYHRRGEPKPSHEPFNTLNPELQDQVTKLAALLRIADGLDLSHTGTVTGIDVDVDKSRVRVDGVRHRRPADGAVGGPPQAPAVREGLRPAAGVRRRPGPPQGRLTFAGGAPTAAVTTEPGDSRHRDRGVGRDRAGQGPTRTGHRPAADVEQRHLGQRPGHGRRRHPPVGQAAGPGQQQDLAGGRQADEHQAQAVPEGGQRRPPAATAIEDRRRPLPVEPAEEEVGRVGRAQAEERDRHEGDEGHLAGGGGQKGCAGSQRHQEERVGAEEPGGEHAAHHRGPREHEQRCAEERRRPPVESGEEGERGAGDGLGVGPRLPAHQGNRRGTRPRD